MIRLIETSTKNHPTARFGVVAVGGWGGSECLK